MTKLVIGNWKMNPASRAEAVKLAQAVVAGAKAFEGALDVGIAPPAPFLYDVGEAVRGSPVRLGAQNVAWEREGAFTGETSTAVLRDAGGTFAIIGHSERRELFGETNAGVNKRLRHLFAEGLQAVLCVGENLKQREAGLTQTILDEQLRGALLNLEPSDLQGLTIAYEPVWAIGTGIVAMPEQISGAHAHIRGYLEAGFGRAAAGGLRVLYGGSVKPDTGAEVFAAPGVDGALVGGASLSADSFTTLLRLAT